MTNREFEVSKKSRGQTQGEEGRGKRKPRGGGGAWGGKGKALGGEKKKSASITKNAPKLKRGN